MPNSTTPSFGVVYPLWNHTRDPGNLLDRLVGEVGIDHITIPVVTGREEHFRPFFFPDTPYFGTEGGWHYQPGAAIAATGVRPHVAAWCGKRDVLRQVCDDARQTGLSFYFRLSFAHGAGLCRNHPQLATTNAWGQAPIEPRPCFSNPQLRALVDATLADLERYEPSGFQLENFELDFDLTTMNWAFETARESLNTCFCSACRQIALAGGVSLDDAVEIARDRVLRPAPDSPAADAAPSPSDSDHTWRAYAEVRRRSLHAWLHALAMAHTGRSCWLVVGDDGRVPPAGWDRMLGTSTFANSPALDLDDAIPPTPGLCCTITTRARQVAADLVVVVQRALAGGTRVFDFAEVECCRFEVLTGLKQAIRYARRG